MEQRTQAVPADASGGKLGLLRVLVACLVASPSVRSQHRRERSTISCGDMSLFAAIPSGRFNRQLRGRAEKADSPACACCQNHDADAARVEDSSTPAPRTYGSLFSSAFASWAKQRVKRRFLTEDRGARLETPAAGEGEDDEIDELSGKMARIKSPMRDEEGPPPRQGASRGTGQGHGTQVLEGGPGVGKQLFALDNTNVSSTGALTIPTAPKKHPLPNLPPPSLIKSEHTSIIVLDANGNVASGTTLQAGPAHSLVLASNRQLMAGRTIHLQRKDIHISLEEFRAIKEEQRANQYFWDTKWAFPFQESRMGREALVRCRHFVCKGLLGCECGDCLNFFETTR